MEDVVHVIVVGIGVVVGCIIDVFVVDVDVAAIVVSVVSVDVVILVSVLVVVAVVVAVVGLVASVSTCDAGDCTSNFTDSSSLFSFGETSSKLESSV